MPNTLPEGVTFPRQEPAVGSRGFLTAVSIIIGVVIGVGVIIGVLGRAFYVERTEYSAQSLRQAEEKVTVAEELKQIRASQSRLEVSVEKLASSVDEIKQRGRR